MRGQEHTGVKSDPKSRKNGFSLIEVMISIVILTVGLLSLAQMMVVATNANALAGRMTASAALAKQQLELLKAAPFYTNPANPSVGAMNPLLASGGGLDSNETVGAVDYFQLYNADGQPVDPGGWVSLRGALADRSARGSQGIHAARHVADHRALSSLCRGGHLPRGG